MSQRGVPYRASFLSQNNLTHAIAGNWAQVFAAKAADALRTGWFLQNISDTTIEVGFGSPEVAICQLAPGQSIGEQFPQSVFQGRIAVRCPVASGKAYYAHEK